MCHRYRIEAVDRTMRDIMRSDDLSWGKCILISGDFRPILTLKQGGSRAQIVHACLKSSPLFSCIQVLHLHENMRLKELQNDLDADSEASDFPEYLVKV